MATPAPRQPLPATDDLVSYPCPGPARCDPQPEYVAPVDPQPEYVAPVIADSSDLEGFVLKPQSPLLCDGCQCALIFAGANAMLVGRCAPCVKRVALAAKAATQAQAARLIAEASPVAADAALPLLVWDRSGSLVTALYDGERANYLVRDGQLVECNGRLPDDAFAELEHDVFGHQNYRGDVPRVAATPRPALDEPEGLRVGLAICATCEDLACDCACRHAAARAAKHWPDCAASHGGAECDMGPECGTEGEMPDAASPQREVRS